MLRRLGNLIVVILFIAIISYGFIKVSSEITPYVKDKSAVKVYYSAKPFDITVDIGDYIFYLNNKVFKNIKNFIEEL